jgi:hypothetical protein
MSVCCVKYVVTLGQMESTAVACRFGESKSNITVYIHTDIDIRLKAQTPKSKENKTFKNLVKPSKPNRPTLSTTAFTFYPVFLNFSHHKSHLNTVRPPFSAKEPPHMQLLRSQPTKITLETLWKNTQTKPSNLLYNCKCLLPRVSHLFLP